MQRKYRFALPDVHRAASEVGADDGVQDGVGVFPVAHVAVGDLAFAVEDEPGRVGAYGVALE